ncbi:hypothetical protein BCF46_0669 [Litoreibacter meonggei]|uniref:Uncharacterized protein n=1 Tax=Litoreibacter meonggei TaxID=1049199 RepID=A0A497X5A7_9RHOB|nr:hypothetical protein [Litoreibacter meonggei]RLJ60468.1 hypothetical protein BCF46_0669 [Litoreibacter meonggei]
MTTNFKADFIQACSELSKSEMLEIASRSALRVFPAILAGVSTGNHPQILLAALRTLVTVTTTNDGDENDNGQKISNCLRDCAQAASYFGANTAARLSMLSCIDSLELLQLPDANREKQIEGTCFAVDHAARSAARLSNAPTRHQELRSILRGEALSDMERVMASGGSSLKTVHLWCESPFPPELKSCWRKFSGSSYSHDGTWGFWRSWYLGHLDGHPFARNILTRIVQVDDVSWRKGPDEIALQIRELEARIQLTNELHTWDETSAEFNLAKPGHNLPPETLDDLSKFEDLTQDVEQELNEERARIGLLNAILVNLKKVQRELGDLLEESGKQLAVDGLKAGATAGLVVVVSQAGKIIEALESWLQALSGLPI